MECVCLGGKWGYRWSLMDELSLVKLGMGLDGRNQSHRARAHVGKEGALAVGIQWFVIPAALDGSRPCSVDGGLLGFLLYVPTRAVWCCSDLQKPEQRESPRSFVLPLVLALGMFDRRGPGRAPRNKSWLVSRGNGGEAQSWCSRASCPGQRAPVLALGREAHACGVCKVLGNIKLFHGGLLYWFKILRRF